MVSGLPEWAILHYTGIIAFEVPFSEIIFEYRCVKVINEIV